MQPEFLRKRVSEHVAAALADATGPVDPSTAGPDIRCGLAVEKQDEILRFGPLLIDELFTQEVKEQTKGRPPTSEQVEAFPLDLWISAAKSGHRIRYRHATWDDHRAHREHQIANLNNVQRAFDVEEQRRERLRRAGMADDPTLTTEEAVRRLQADSEAA